MYGAGKHTKTSNRAWRAVFKKDPKDPKVLPARAQKCFEDALCVQRTTASMLKASLLNELQTCMGTTTTQIGQLLVDEFGDDNGMTVEEWVTTPWHYEHLPYRSRSAVFKDGECYSEGCTRCSRRFFEYEHVYYGDWKTMKRARHWPSRLYTPNEVTTSTCHAAPIPFHDPQFWSTTPFKGRQSAANEKSIEEEAAARQTQREGRRGRAMERSDRSGNVDLLDTDGVGGAAGATEADAAGMTVKELKAELGKLGIKPEGRKAELIQQLVNARQQPLPREQSVEEELRNRVRPGTDGVIDTPSTVGTYGWPAYAMDLNLPRAPSELRKFAKEIDKPLYRRYYNAAYDEAKQYKTIWSGRVTTPRHQIKYGMEGLHLMRSHKHGNVCRDCAAVLTMAPHLFIRNNRVTMTSGLIAGDTLHAMANSGVPFWTLLDGKVDYSALMKSKAEVAKLKGAAREQWDAEFDKAAEDMTKLLKQTGTMHWPKNYTKYATPATINVQAHVEAPSSKEQKADVGAAVDLLGKLVQLLQLDDMDERQDSFDTLNEHLRTQDAARKVFIDIANDTKRRYIFNNEVALVDQTSQFDSDIERTEYRNCVLSLQDGEFCWLMDESKLTWDPNNEDLSQGKQVDATLKGVYGKLTRERYRNAANRVYYNCLITVQYDPQTTGDVTLVYELKEADLEKTEIKVTREGKLFKGKVPPRPNAGEKIKLRRQVTVANVDPKDYRIEVYLCTRCKPHGEFTHPKQAVSMWRGDGYVTAVGDKPSEIWTRLNPPTQKALLRQTRSLRQTRLFITYSLHRSVLDERVGNRIMTQMADAAYELFGNEKWLSQLVVCGKKLVNVESDVISRANWASILKTRKESAMENFYGGDRPGGLTSYIYDTYETHVERVDVDGGIEVGPKMKHPHFHILLTLDHYTYAQFDFFKMKAFLEIMFKGIPTYHGWGDKFRLVDESGGDFYDDNENPYVDIRLYPQDNWKEIIAAYVRKPLVGGGMVATAGKRAPTRV